MSQALRDIIPIMGLLQEMRERGFKVLCTEPYVYCKVFEDNSGALELARLPKEHVRKGLIKIFALIPRIRLPMLSPNLWHKMIFSVTVASCAASNLHKQPK